MKKKEGNILMVSNYPSDTAYAWWLMEHFWITLSDIFSRKNRKSYLAFPKINSLSDTLKNSTIKSVELIIPWKNKSQKEQVISFIKRNNISTIYFTDQVFFNPTYASLRMAGIRHIIIHDHTPGDRPNITGFRGLLKALRNSMPFLSANLVINVSDLMRKRSINNGRIPPNKCISVQNGIPLIISKENRVEVRKNLNIPDEAIVAVTTGRAHPYKRFDLILEAAALIKNASPDKKIVFIFVGNGPALHELIEQAKSLNLSQNVKFLGFREDVKDLLGASDFAIHAALGEGFSLSIIEYMGAGLPVLVPDIPSVKQAIRHDKNGYVYRSDSSQDLAKYIAKLESSEALRHRLGQEAKSDASENYSLDECTSQFHKAITSMLL